MSFSEVSKNWTAKGKGYIMFAALSASIRLRQTGVNIALACLPLRFAKAGSGFTCRNASRRQAYRNLHRKFFSVGFSNSIFSIHMRRHANWIGGDLTLRVCGSSHNYSSLFAECAGVMASDFISNSAMIPWWSMPGWFLVNAASHSSSIWLSSSLPT